MNNKTLETALFSLSAGCLVISIYETMTRGLSWAYLWLMMSVGLWLGYTFLKRKRRAAESGGANNKELLSGTGSKNAPNSGKASGQGRSVSKSGKKRT